MAQELTEPWQASQRQAAEGQPVRRKPKTRATTEAWPTAVKTKNKPDTNNTRTH